MLIVALVLIAAVALLFYPKAKKHFGKKETMDMIAPDSLSKPKEKPTPDKEKKVQSQKEKEKITHKTNNNDK